MRTYTRIFDGWLLLGAGLSLACGGEDETRIDGGGDVLGSNSASIAGTPSIPIPPPFSERLASKRGWGEWQELGRIEVMPEETKANLALARRESSERPRGDDQPEVREGGFIVDDLVSQLRYRGRYEWERWFTPEELLAPRGDETLEPGDPDAERREAVEKKGWSGGTDNRTRRDIAGWGTAFNPYSRFAFVGSGCSGSIIRQTQNGTFALTAAHCMYDDAGNPIWTTVQPRRDNGTLPYGTWDVITIHRYDYWVDNACYSGNSQADDCRRYDIALLELSPRAGASYPGGMTYGSYARSTIDGNTKYHRGYPACGGADSPASCVSRTLYGDESHGVSNFHQGDRLFDHSSDLNGGHSGGPMYFYTDGQAKFYGVQSGQYCSGASCSGSDVNIAVRITGDWFDYMFDQLHH
jgi:V8-like Glu-specific endopeptidase